MYQKKAKHLYIKFLKCKKNEKILLCYYFTMSFVIIGPRRFRTIKFLVKRNNRSEADQMGIKIKSLRTRNINCALK